MVRLVLFANASNAKPSGVSQIPGSPLLLDVHDAQLDEPDACVSLCVSLSTFLTVLAVLIMLVKRSYWYCISCSPHPHCRQQLWSKECPGS